jgi:hypothetical protein
MVRGERVRMEVRTRAVVVALLMLVAMPSAATQAAGAEATQAGEPPAPAGQQPRPESEAAAPVTTFTPTEKIQADSVVSFPVDI